MSYEAVPEENAAPRWRKYAAMGAVALTAFAGVSAYSQYGAAAQKSSDGSPARKIISSLARSIQSKAMGDDDVIAPGVSCTEMSEVRFQPCGMNGDAGVAVSGCAIRWMGHTPTREGTGGER